MDTSFFVYFADAYDQLLPIVLKPFPALKDVTKDTTAFLADHSERKVNIEMQQVNYSVKKSDTTSFKTLYVFDKQPRIVKTVMPLAWDMTTMQYSYYRGNVLASIIATNSKGSDTMRFSYDRTQHLSEISFRNNSKDTLTHEEFLYDSKGHLIIARNINFHNHLGTYVYEYNSEGRLCGRQFLDRKSGIVLSTDTIAFQTWDTAGAKIYFTHSVRVSGFSDWKMIDDGILDINSNLLLQYHVNGGKRAHPQNGIDPGWTVTYTYDDHGRKLTQLNADSTNHFFKRAEYFYGAGNTSDSVLTYKISIFEGARIEELSKIAVTHYDAKGRIVKKTSMSYDTVGRGQKQEVMLVEKRTETWNWIN